MSLVVQMAGIGLLGAFVGSLMLSGSSRPATAGGVVLLAVAVAGLAFWGAVWGTGRTFVEQSEHYPSIHDANVAPGSLFPADETLLTSAEALIPRQASVYLICQPNAVGCSGEWVTYQLSPRLFVDNISEAQYVLVYGASPRAVTRTMHLAVMLDRPDGGVVRTGGSL